MLRGLTLAMAVSVALLGASIPASAGESWCEADPVLTIDGRTVDYTASLPQSYASDTTIAWTFHIPANVALASAVTPPAPGSPAVRQTVRIVRDLPAYSLLSTAKVVTTVTFTASASYPTLTAVKGLNAQWTSYAGRSNRTLTFATGYQLLVGLD